MKFPSAIATLAAPLAGITIAAEPPVQQQQTPPNRIVTQSSVGEIHSSTTLGDLHRIFGTGSVLDAEISLQEGATAPGVRIREESDDFLEIVWSNDFRTGEFKPVGGKFGNVVGQVIIHGRNWKTEQGIGIGSSLQEVQQANGIPFELGPFETDMHGQVDSWNDGVMGKEIQVGFHTQVDLPGEDYQRYVFERGDKPFLSSDPEFARMQPIVGSLAVDWGTPFFEMPVENILFAVGERVYASSQELGEEIANLNEPWDRLFTLTDIDGAEVPLLDENWRFNTVFEGSNFACLEATSSAYIPILRAVFSSAILLVQKAEPGPSVPKGGFRVVDLIFREGAGYDHLEVNGLTGVLPFPQLHLIDTLSDGRRAGTVRHQVYSIAESEEGILKFEPAVAFDAAYTQYERNEDCELHIGSGGRLRVTVTHEWMKEAGREPQVNSVFLPWNAEERTYDISPLEGLVSGNGFETRIPPQPPAVLGSPSTAPLDPGTSQQSPQVTGVPTMKSAPVSGTSPLSPQLIGSPPIAQPSTNTPLSAPPRQAGSSELPGSDYTLAERIEHEFAATEIARDLVLEVYDWIPDRDKPEQPTHKLVVASASEPSRKALLLSYSRGAQPLLSPDGQWIVVNDRPYRGFCNPRLFRTSGGVNFTEDSGSEIRKKALEFLAGSEKFSAEQRAELEEDSFVEAQRWGRDGRSLLIRISKTYSGGSFFVDDWICVYDLETSQFSQDLTILNRAAVSLRE